MTLPLIHVLQVLAASERERVEQLFADPDPDDEEIDSVVRLVSDNGGLDYALRRAEAWGARAEEALAEVPAGEARDALQDAVRYVIHRRR
jgi:geranylgeranyl pyrophosphate synthase